MDSGAQTVVMQQCAPGEVRGVLLEAERKGRGGEGDTIDRLMPRGLCFKVMQAGKIIGAYLLELNGSEVFILAAAGRAECDMTEIFAHLIEQQAMQFDTIAFKTKRPGLIKKAQALGYVAEGNILRKRLAR